MNATFFNNISDTNTVIGSLRNSHCIICGTPFNTERAGKLYCSAKCKQIGYNHKEKIIQYKNISDTGINAKSQTFYLEDFQYYDKRQKMLKRYRELCRKQSTWESIESEILNCEKAKMPVNDFTRQRYISRRLSDNEQCELNDLETELEDEIIDLNLRELSLEQWSFISSLHPSFDRISFCEIIVSLGNDFFSQLNLSPLDRNTNQNVLIKNKYINHCNLIAEGLIKFVKKPVNVEDEN